MFKVYRYFIALTVLILNFIAHDLSAQGTDASISGIVAAEDGDPLPGATILAVNESTGFQVGASTDVHGKFLIKDLPLGGPYSLRISFIGYQPVSLRGYQLNLGDHIIVDKISLTGGTTVLKEMQVTSNAFLNRKDRLGSSVAVTERHMQKLPTTSRNYTELAALSPHTKGGSIGGNKAGTQGYLLDGVTNRRTVFGEPVGGAFPISMETIREFEIVTNSYDVTNGRGSGGVIKAVTKSGTNDFHGSAWSYFSGDVLTGDTDINGKAIKNDFSVIQYGASISGPIVRDKLHFFASYDRYENKFPFRAFDFQYEGTTLEEAEKNLAITQENLQEVVSILENDYGVPNVTQFGEIQVARVTNNFFGKLDWKMNKLNTLTLRYNFQNFDDPAKLKGNGLLSTQYKGYERDHSIMLALKSQFNDHFYNDLKVSFMDNERLNQLIYPRTPEGFVEVESTFGDGTTNKRTVAFGNQNWVPEIIASSSYQLINNTTFRTGKYLFTFGTDNIITRIKDRLTHRQQGEFHYRSLNDLRTNTPWRFTRKIPVGGAGGKVFPEIYEFGLYAQVETDLTPNVSFTGGIRWDGTYLPTAPKYNALLDQELGIRNDVKPFDANNIQPRVNFNWNVDGNGRDILKVGAGWFASQFTSQAFTMAHIDDGISFKEVDVRNNDVPAADWISYYQDFNTVPGEEYLNSLNLPTLPAFVIALDKNLETPMTFKTNISYHRYLADWLSVGAGVYYNNTKNSYIYLNRNLVEQPYFTSANEGNREVYVPASTLIGKDRADYNNARRSNNFTQVLQFTNADWNDTYLAFVFEASLQLRDGMLNFSYTRAQSKGGPQYSSGNATDIMAVGSSYWGYGNDAKNSFDNEDMKHKIVLSGVSPTFYGFTVSTTFSLFQWNRFSANVNQDINGDISRNDLAYIFNPNDPSTPENIAAEMRTLLEVTSPEFKKYLEENMGTIAPWNGGLMPWRSTWNLSLAKEFKTFKEQKLVLRADIFNVLNVLNHEWGGYKEIINTNLYNVTGFDASTNNYTYSVNQNSGTKRKAGTPYNIQFGIKYIF